jgi:hypothetical protein
MIHSSLRPAFYAGLLLLIVINPVVPVRGQITGPSEIFEESVGNFEAGKYRLALAGFLQLKQTQPDHVMNFYYLGRCLVELNEQLDDAIEYLNSASRRGAPGDALYYLAKAYHRDYNFSEAIKYYGRFEQVASRQQMKDLKVAQMISTSRSALEITSTYNQYEVITVAFLDLNDSLSYSQIRMKGGQMQRKPSGYFEPGEQKGGLGSLMFMPYSSLRGEYIFYAGPGKNGKGGMQLFRARKGTGKLWGEPEEIKTLNTEGDELLPYFDPIESDLYYTSDGGSGVGGFDLFRSHFDPERDEWTNPINLGFPINSAMDDYLLLPGSDLGMMMFFSNRQGTDSTLTVYRVHLVEPKLKTDAGNTKMLSGIATLGGAADEILAEIEAVSLKRAVEDDIRTGNEQNAGAGNRAQIYTPVKILPTSEMAPIVVSTERAFLSEALMHQAASDSLKDLATEARARVRESDDPNDRWVWQKQIMVWEKKAHDEEALADILYASMDGGSQDSQPASPVNLPESLSPMVVEGEPGSQPEMNSVSAGGGGHFMNRFDILGSSPYSESNPIPTDVAFPDGVFYRIQLGAFGRAVDPGTFGGISPITAETIKERGLIKYYAGKFTKYEDASTALSLVRSLGYEDSFVSAWYDGIPVSTQKAKQLE